MIKPLSKLIPGLSNKWRLGYSGVALLALMMLVLNGCHSGIVAPKGKIAAAQLDLAIFSIELMLLVVIPVIVMSCWFGWRYREGNNAKYTPEWTHSTNLELVWWTIPCIIILILGTVTWKTTHSLDPYKTLDSTVKPVNIEVVSLDWKWLFIYPDYKIATTNILKLPVDTPINFKITAASPMNSFIIPQLGGQIYAMTGMITQLHLIGDVPGTYRGLATNYTGIGFADMQFMTEVTSAEDFESWVNSVKDTPVQLTSSVFWEQLMPKSINDKPRYFGRVDDGLFNRIISHYMMPELDCKKA